MILDKIEAVRTDTINVISTDSVNKVDSIKYDSLLDTLFLEKMDSLAGILANEKINAIINNEILNEGTFIETYGINIATLIVLATAAYLSYKSIKNEGEAKEREYHHSYYDIIIIQPVTKVVDSYIADVSEFLLMNKGKKPSVRRGSHILTELNNMHTEFHQFTILSFEGWNEEGNKLRNKVTDHIMVLEDRFSEYLGKNIKEYDLNILIEMFYQTQGKIYSTIMEFDPYMKKAKKVKKNSGEG